MELQSPDDYEEGVAIETKNLSSSRADEVGKETGGGKSELGAPPAAPKLSSTLPTLSTIPTTALEATAADIDNKKVLGRCTASLQFPLFIVIACFSIRPSAS